MEFKRLANLAIFGLFMQMQISFWTNLFNIFRSALSRQNIFRNFISTAGGRIMSPRRSPRGGFLQRGSHSPRERIKRDSKRFTFSRDLIEDQELFDYETGELNLFLHFMVKYLYLVTIPHICQYILTFRHFDLLHAGSREITKCCTLQSLCRLI